MSGSTTTAGGRRSAAIPLRRRPGISRLHESGRVGLMATASALRAGDSIKELTIRGIILGALITVVFTAANVYLGLKIGITFATSIPAAVISMAVLKAFRDATIQENNIVQTIASAAGTLSAIIFVLPGLIMIGYWNHFP